MDQSEIRRRYTEAKTRLDDARLAYEMAKGGPGGVIHALQRICNHPHKFETSCMGDMGWKCDDCGWAV